MKPLFRHIPRYLFDKSSASTVFVPQEASSCDASENQTLPETPTCQACGGGMKAMMIEKHVFFQKLLGIGIFLTGMGFLLDDRREFLGIILENTTHVCLSIVIVLTGLSLMSGSPHAVWVCKSCGKMMDFKE